jgi:Subtilase family
MMNYRRQVIAITLTLLFAASIAGAESWRSPLLDLVRVVVEKPMDVPDLPAELSVLVGDLDADYPAFVVTYLVPEEAHRLVETAARLGVVAWVDATDLVRLPFQVVHVPDLARRGDRFAGTELEPRAVPGLWLAQFAYPIRAEWLDQLASCGAETLAAFQPRTVLLRAASAEAVRVCAPGERLAWIEPFLTTDRIEPAIFAPEVGEYWLQHLPGVEENAARSGLPQAVRVLESWQPPGENPDRTYFQRVSASRADLSEILATSPTLLAVVAAGEPAPSDERQSQILAGNHDGVTVTTPGYIDWLDGRGLLNGAHQQTVAVFDTGWEDGLGPFDFDHPDFGTPPRVLAGRIEVGTTLSDASGHGTTVAGIIAGNGEEGSGAVDAQGFAWGTGVAPRANLVVVKIFDYQASACGFPTSNTSGLEQAFAFARNTGGTDSALVANHSWNVFPPGSYDSQSLLFDRMVVDANSNLAGEQPMTVVVAAGNFGPGDNSVAAPATAKNVLAVGATENYRPSTQPSQPPLVCTGWSNPSDATDIRQLAVFSSRGAHFKRYEAGDPPGAAIYAHNVRIKPDLVAPGVRITSTVPYQTPETYVCPKLCQQYFPTSPLTYHAYGQGTSFAAPAASGAAAIARKWFLDRGTDPPPSLVKAALIATADDLGGTACDDDHRPSNDHGWGRISLDRLTDPSAERFVVPESSGLALATGQERTFTVGVADPAEPVLITLVWSDPPSSVGNSQVPLANDLRLIVERPGGPGDFWRGNNFHENHGECDDGFSHHFVLGGDPVLDDALNTVESVFIPGGTVAAGTQLRLRVVGADVAQGTQRFSLYAHNVVDATPITIGESGLLTTLTHVPQTVVLSHNFQSPVVFAQPVSTNGGQAAVVRVSDVLSDRFTLFVHEPPNLDGSHLEETVSYVVLEAGRWGIAGGSVLEVGSAATSATVGQQGRRLTWKKVVFSAQFPETPVVLSQVQTTNDPHWVKTRQRDPLPSSVFVAMEEEEAKTTGHQIETVGWLAVTPGAGTWSGKSFVADTQSGVTDVWSLISFSPPFAQSPIFVAGLGSYADGDNAHVRYTGLGGLQVQVRIEEDTTLDSETSHTVGELVPYLVIEGSGLLEGSPQP